MTTTLPDVSPQPRGVTPPAIAAKLKDVGRTKREIDARLRHLVLEALAAGGSVRDIANLAGISTNTVARWKKEGGL